MFVTIISNIFFLCLIAALFWPRYQFVSATNLEKKLMVEVDRYRWITGKTKTRLKFVGSETLWFFEGSGEPVDSLMAKRLRKWMQFARLTGVLQTADQQQ